MTTSAPPVKPTLCTRTWTGEVAARAARAFGAGSTYFLAIALASWVFGRSYAGLVRHGPMGAWAVLLEAAALLLGLALAAAAVIRLFGVRDRAGDRLLVGAFAITLMLATELVGGPLVRSWGLYETLTGLVPEPSGAVLALLVGAVLTPLLKPIRLARRVLKSR